MTKKSEMLTRWKRLGVIFLAALCSAASLEILLIPSEVVMGCLTGISSILDILLSEGNWYFSAGFWLIALNVPTVIYAFVKFRRGFALRTLLFLALLSAMLIVFRMTHLAETFGTLIAGDETSDKVVYTILGGALHGLALPLMLSVNASTGGSDIVSLMLQRTGRRTASQSMRIVLLIDVVIVTFSALAMYLVHRDTERAVNLFIYSVAALFVCEIVQEFIFRGFSAAIELEITTDKPAEMEQRLREELKHGTSIIKIVGGYSKTEKTMVLCVINKRQLIHARRIIRQVDSQAFAYVENVREVLGKGFSNKEAEIEEE